MNLDELRTRIDGLDDQLCRLFAERLACVDQIGAAKKERALPPADEGREAAILSRLRAQTDDNLWDDTEALYHAIFAICRARQGR